MFKSLSVEINLSPFIYLYDVNTFRQYECTYALDYSKYTGVSDYRKAFFLRNHRKPHDYDIEYIDFLTKTVNMPVNSNIHINTYVVQSIYDKYGDIEVSSKIISDVYKDIMKCNINDDNLHEIGRYIRYKFGKSFSDKGYNIINVWQLMKLSAVISSNNILKNDNNIRLLFNKIYKREPLSQEVQIIASLDLDLGIQGIRNEIIKHFKVAYETSFRRRRLKRY